MKNWQHKSRKIKGFKGYESKLFLNGNCIVGIQPVNQQQSTQIFAYDDPANKNAEKQVCRRRQFPQRDRQISSATTFSTSS